MRGWQRGFIPEPNLSRHQECWPGKDAGPAVSLWRTDRHDPFLKPALGGREECLYTLHCPACRPTPASCDGPPGSRQVDEGLKEEGKGEYQKVPATKLVLPKASKSPCKSPGFYAQVLIFRGALSNRP